MAPLATQSESQSLWVLTTICLLPPPMAAYTIFSPVILPLVHPTWRSLGSSSTPGTLTALLHLFSGPRTLSSQIASSMAHYITCFRALLTHRLSGEAFPDLYIHFAPLLLALCCSAALPSDLRARTLPLIHCPIPNYNTFPGTQKC